MRLKPLAIIAILSLALLPGCVVTPVAEPIGYYQAPVFQPPVYYAAPYYGYHREYGYGGRHWR